jgi:hypothetical protein
MLELRFLGLLKVYREDQLEIWHSASVILASHLLWTYVPRKIRRLKIGLPDPFLRFYNNLGTLEREKKEHRMEVTADVSASQLIFHPLIIL